LHLHRDALASVALLLALLFAAGCGSSGAPAAAPSTPSTALASVSATRAPGSTPSPAPSAAALPADVLAIVHLLSTATTGAELLAHARLTPTECREKLTQMSFFTKCPPGSRSGDFVPLFRMASCEAGTEPDVSNKALDDWAAHARSLHAVIREDRSAADLYNWIPLGDYGVIYRFDEGFGILFTVADGRIVGATTGCGSTPEGLLRTVPPGRVLLGPLPAQ